MPAGFLLFLFYDNILLISLINLKYFTYRQKRGILTSQTEREENGMKTFKKKDLWTLFKTMFILSACTFGGGFVIVSLMNKKFVEELKWLEEDEMLDITAITQSCPGPLPVNASVIIGYRMYGVIGSLVAVLGTILPPMVIISLICVFYEQFRTNTYIAIALQVMRAGVAAVILDVTLDLAKNVIKTKSALYIGLMITAFAATYFFGVSAMLIIIICLFIGIGSVIYGLYKDKRGVKNYADIN